MCVCVLARLSLLAVSFFLLLLPGRRKTPVFPLVSSCCIMSRWNSGDERTWRNLTAFTNKDTAEPGAGSPTVSELLHRHHASWKYSTSLLLITYDGGETPTPPNRGELSWISKTQRNREKSFVSLELKSFLWMDEPVCADSSAGHLNVGELSFNLTVLNHLLKLTIHLSFFHMKHSQSTGELLPNLFDSRVWLFYLLKSLCSVLKHD